MGHGIAQVFALADHDVTLTDADAPTLASARDRILVNLLDLGDDVTAVERVRVCAGLAEAVTEADFVVEAVREDLGVTQQLFADIERVARPDAILASNTWVIPDHHHHGQSPKNPPARSAPTVNRLIGTVGRSDQTEWTAPAAIDFTLKLHADIGETPVHVKKDVPGFVGSRLQHALWREAIAGRERHLQRRNRRHRDQGRTRPSARGARSLENADPSVPT
jgi:3-hydroxybutyryl-CoA dehydrogenase